ncbi:MAG: sugar phosphate nucleotidyltransferase [bacterium]|nr:sugar phosphate nucleotidyltransferase [bacterium]
MNGLITKAIIPIAGLATRFLPLSKAISKELLPVGTKPMLQYALEELKAAGVNTIIFVVGQNKKMVSDFLRRAPQLEKILEEKKYEDLLSEFKALEKLLEGMSFSFVSAPPLGDGHAILQARKLIGEETCFVAFPDDIIQSKSPCTEQLAQIFKTSQKSVVALSRVPKDRISAYGVVAAEKIATRFWKIQKIVEKPEIQSAPSDLAVVGRYVITPEVFDYLKKAKPNKKGEIVLGEVLGEMLKEGKMIYGYEFEGAWWECGDRAKWLRSHLALSLQHPLLGPQLQKFLKEEKFISS